MTTALLAPAYRLTVGEHVIDTTDEPRASTVLDLTVSLDLDIPADAVTVTLGQVGSLTVALGDAVTVELGYHDDQGLTRVITGTVTHVRPGLVTRHVAAHTAAAGLLGGGPNETFLDMTAGDIVRRLAQDAGVGVGDVDDGIRFPAYVGDGRRSALRHILDLAELCGFDAFIDPDGDLVFRAFRDDRPAPRLRFAKELLAVEVAHAPARADAVETWGEGPGGDHGEDGWAWLTTDFSGRRGQAGQGDRTLLLERPVLRTSEAAQAAADAALAVIRHRAVRGRLLIVGRPDIRLGDAVEISDVPHPGIDGRYQVRSVTHRIAKDRGGFTSVVGVRSLG